MNDDLNDPYTHQHRLNMFAGDIQTIFRKHVDNSASITWDEAVDMVRTTIHTSSFIPSLSLI